MKKILLLSLISFISLNVYSKREISSVYFYTCYVERNATDDKKFNKDFVFQITEDKNDYNKILRTARWNQVEITLKNIGELSISIQESLRNGEKLSFNKAFPLPDFSLDTPPTFVQKANLSKTISYKIECK